MHFPLEILKLSFFSAFFTLCWYVVSCYEKCANSHFLPNKKHVKDELWTSEMRGKWRQQITRAFSMGYDTKEAFVILSCEWYGMGVSLEGLFSVALSQPYILHAELLS